MDYDHLRLAALKGSFWLGSIMALAAVGLLIFVIHFESSLGPPHAVIVVALTAAVALAMVAAYLIALWVVYFFGRLGSYVVSLVAARIPTHIKSGPNAHRWGALAGCVISALAVAFLLTDDRPKNFTVQATTASYVTASLVFAFIAAFSPRQRWAMSSVSTYETDWAG